MDLSRLTFCFFFPNKTVVFTECKVFKWINNKRKKEPGECRKKKRNSSRLVDDRKVYFTAIKRLGSFFITGLDNFRLFDLALSRVQQQQQQENLLLCIVSLSLSFCFALCDLSSRVVLGGGMLPREKERDGLNVGLYGNTLRKDHSRRREEKREWSPGNSPQRLY